MKKNAEETREKIKNAFLKLYKEKRIEKISIGELAKEAKIYRGTFYYYYEDIYDLLSKIEEEFFNESIKDVVEVVQGILSNDIEERVISITNNFKKYEDLMRLFFITRPNIKLINKIKETAKGKAVETLGIDVEKLSNEDKYILEYIASAQVGIVTKWIENNRDIDAVSLGNIMKRVNLIGPMTYLKEKYIKWKYYIRNGKIYIMQ